MKIPMHVVKWAAQKCERQKSGEMSVYYNPVAPPDSFGGSK